MIHYESSVGGLWYGVYEAKVLSWLKKLTKIVTDNGRVQENNYTDFTNPHSSELEEKKETEDAMRRKKGRQQGGSIWKTLLQPVCVFSENVAGGHFLISNPISLRDPVSVAADCWSPLEALWQSERGGHSATLAFYLDTQGSYSFSLKKYSTNYLGEWPHRQRADCGLLRHCEGVNQGWGFSIL